MNIKTLNSINDLEKNINDEKFLVHDINQKKYLEEKVIGSNEYNYIIKISNSETVKNLVENKINFLNEFMSELGFYVWGNFRNAIFIFILNLYLLLLLFIDFPIKNNIIFINNIRFNANNGNSNCDKMFNSDNICDMYIIEKSNILFNFNNIFYNNNLVIMIIWFSIYLITFIYEFKFSNQYQNKDTKAKIFIIFIILFYLMNWVFLILYFFINYNLIIFIISFNIFSILIILMCIYFIYFKKNSFNYYIKVLFYSFFMIIFDVLYYNYINEFNIYDSFIKYPLVILLINYCLILLLLIIKFIFFGKNEDKHFIVYKRYLYNYQIINLLFLVKIIFIFYNILNNQYFYIIYIIAELIIVIIYLILFFKKSIWLEKEIIWINKDKDKKKYLYINIIIPIINLTNSCYYKKNTNIEEEHKRVFPKSVKKIKKFNFSTISLKNIDNKSDLIIDIEKINQVFDKYINKDIRIKSRKNLSIIQENNKNIIKNKDNDKSLCLCCYTEEANILIYDCFHGRVCYDCIFQLWSKNNQCFICKKTIKYVFIINKLSIITNLILKKTEISNKMVEFNNN